MLRRKLPLVSSLLTYVSKACRECSSLFWGRCSTQFPHVRLNYVCLGIDPTALFIQQKQQCGVPPTECQGSQNGSNFKIRMGFRTASAAVDPEVLVRSLRHFRRKSQKRPVCKASNKTRDRSFNVLVYKLICRACVRACVRVLSLPSLVIWLYSASLIIRAKL